MAFAYRLGKEASGRLRNMARRTIDTGSDHAAVNTGGSRPPIFWVFNDANEPGALAAKLGSVSRFMHFALRI